MRCKTCFIIALILAIITFFCGMKKGKEKVNTENKTESKLLMLKEK